MISKRHWLVAGSLAVSLHAVAFYTFFYQPSEGSQAPGYQGIEFDLGMKGDMGASATNSVERTPAQKIEETKKEVVKPEPEKEKVEEPKPVVEEAPPEPIKEPQPTPKEAVKEKPVVTPKPVEQKQKSPVIVHKEKPKKEVKKEPKVIPKKVEPKPTPKKVEPTPEKTPPKKAVSSTSKQASEQQSAKEASNSGPQSKANQKATTGVGSASSSGGSQGAQTSYYTKLGAIFAQNKRYPRASRRRNEEGVVTVSFVVHANGQISDVDITKSSGYRRLDKAVLDMLKRAAPLPAFSSDMKVSQLPITLPVSFKLSDY